MRTKTDDKSGIILADNLTTAGHSLAEKTIVSDNIHQIRAVISRWVADESVQVIIVLIT
ncbi:MAG: molybdopterin-binding protein [Cyanobacteria bacterium J06621_8]